MALEPPPFTLEPGLEGPLNGASVTFDARRTMVPPAKNPAFAARRPANEALEDMPRAGAASPRAQAHRIDHSPRLLAQLQAVQALEQAPAMSAQGARLGAMFGHGTHRSPAIGPVMQRKITVADRTYGMQDETLDELKIDIDREMDTIEAALRPSGVSVDQVLTRFDFRNLRFANMAALIKAVRQELKQDLGADDPGVDRLLTVHPLERDQPELLSPELDKLLSLDPTGNIKNLVLEDTDAAKMVMDEYRKASQHPKSDTAGRRWPRSGR